VIDLKKNIITHTLVHMFTYADFTTYESSLSFLHTIFFLYIYILLVCLSLSLIERTKHSKELTIAREHQLKQMEKDGSAAVAAALHIDDLSSDDEEAGNTIGKVPLRWYEVRLLLSRSLSLSLVYVQQ
jgi:Ca2+/Na+ antiporter